MAGDDSQGLAPRPARDRWGRSWWIALALLCVAATALYFLFQLRAFLNLRFFAVDYGMYDNTIWNIAHGNGFFTSAKGKSYLTVHFSPFLALMAPLYLIWDTSLWPMIVQDAALGSGGFLLGVCARRLGAPAPAAFLLTLLYCFELLAQRVYLAEFHTVAVQAPFVFAFVLAVLGGRDLLSLLWAAILLSTREDAFLGLAPLALFLAWRQRRWFPAAVGAGALAYGALVLTTLFPMISGMSIFARRKGGFQLFESWESLRGLFSPERFAGARQLLPHAALVLAAGSWIIVCAAPLLQIFLSGFGKQHLLQEHYAATVRPYLFLAMAAGAGRLASSGRRRLLSAALAVSLLFGLVLAMREGPMPPFPRAHTAYRFLYPRYLSLHRLRDRIPPEADVAAPDHIYPHLAHRARIRRYDGAHLFPPPDYYLLDASTGRGRLLPEGLHRFWSEWDYSLAGADGRFALLRHGGGEVDYEGFRDLFYQLEVETTPRKTGTEVAATDASSGMARRVEHGTAPPAFLSFGRPWPLERGEYVCLLRVRNPSPAGEGFGELEAHDFDAQQRIASLPFRLPPSSEWDEAALSFALPEAARVEIRVIVSGGTVEADRILLDGPGLREEFDRLFGGAASGEHFEAGSETGTILAGNHERTDFR